jgi:hypothetical protein
MEFYNNVGFELHIHELEYDLGFIGCAVVYRQIYDVIRVKQIYFDGDHLATQFIESELFDD